MNIFKYINILFNAKYVNSSVRTNQGEQLACKYLKNRGFDVIEKNYKTRYGEIDIIAVHQDVLCFIEVKSRKSTEYGLPEEYVDRRKQQKLIKTSLIYCINTITPVQDRRFDVVSVDLNNGQCRLIKNAFEVNI